MKQHAHSREWAKHWWPDVAAVPDDGPGVTFSLFDRLTGDALIKDYNTHSYWTCKWIKTSDFTTWRGAHTPTAKMTAEQLGAGPSNEPDEYILKFRFHEVDYVWETGEGIHPL